MLSYIHTASESSWRPTGEGGSDLGGVEGGEGNRVGGTCVGEGGASGKNTTGRMGETGEGEHSAAMDMSWVGDEPAEGVMVWEDREEARQMIGSDMGDSKGGVVGVDAAF